MILGLESTSSRMTRLGKGVLTDTEILSLDELAQRMDDVTAGAGPAMSAEPYDPNRMSIVGIGSDEGQFAEVVPADLSGGPQVVGDAARIKVAVSGALGRMGKATCEAVRQDDELVLAAVVDPGFADALESGSAGPTGGVERFVTLDDALATGGIDVVVDFTTPAVVRDNVLLSIRRLTPMVVGTTGLSEVTSRRSASRLWNTVCPCWWLPTSRWGRS